MYILLVVVDDFCMFFWNIHYQLSVQNVPISFTAVSYTNNSYQECPRRIPELSFKGKSRLDHDLSALRHHTGKSSLGHDFTTDIVTLV